MAEPLTPDRVVEILVADMGARGAETPLPTSPIDDEAWVDLVHAIYDPPVVVND